MDRRKYLSTYLKNFFLHRKMWESEWTKRNRSGLTSNQAIVLLILYHSGPQQAKDLMGLLGVSSGGVTVIADKLIELGAVRRNKKEEDRRGVLLELTDKGRELFPIAEADFNGVMDHIFAGLTDPEVAMLAQLFGKLVDMNE
ncbi:MarR family winged helix-turn-helix transcriptional regulator [Cohnella pontilimi]|uniref:MarR family winged helix-turn-helix transcriptional regulator n=1 Tax=Cohnella pontilimi TaxID=2564100 RepID=UPI00145E0077|nr:MarR family transcriptional regulator [Cohnella pontilimi]